MRNTLAVALALQLGIPSLAVAQLVETPYSFTLPENWRNVSDPDVVAYESNDKRQQLTVSEYVLRKSVSQTELRHVLERLLDARRKAELELANGDATVGDPSYIVEPSVIKAEFWGSRQSSRFHSVTIVWATANRIVSWRFETTDIGVLRDTVSLVKATIRVN